MADDKDRTVVEFPEKRGPGRPKGAKDRNPGSARRKAAGKANPWKHGGYAEGSGQFAPPCKSTTCPLEFPCAIRKLRDEAGLPTSRCLATSPDLEEFGSDEVRQVYEAAAGGDTKALDELARENLSLQAEVLFHELRALKAEGATIPQYMRDESGAIVMLSGKPVVTGLMLNRGRLEAVAVLAKSLGFTGKEQLMTPEAQDREPPLGADSVLDEVRQRRRKLGR